MEIQVHAEGLVRDYVRQAVQVTVAELVGIHVQVVARVAAGNVVEIAQVVVVRLVLDALEIAG